MNDVLSGADPDARRGGVVKLKKPAGNFELIPRKFIQHAGLTQDSKFLGIWLCAKPEGWSIHARQIWRELAWTEKRWYSASRNLRDHGFLLYQKSKNDAGFFEHRYELSLEPDFLLISKEIPSSRFALSGQPLSANRPEIDKTFEEKKEVDKNNNNNCELTSDQPVVVEFDLLDRLITHADLININLILKDQPQTRRQLLIDELAGALRNRGRDGPSGIKNPGRFLASFLKVQDAHLTYAAGERALRLSRLAAASREKLSSQSPPTQSTPEPVRSKPSPAVQLQIDQILKRKRSVNVGTTQ